MEIIWRVISWEGKGREWGNGAGIKEHILQEQNRHREVKNSIGNGEAKELPHTTYEHELN